MRWKGGLIKALLSLAFIWGTTGCALFSDDEQLNPQEAVVDEGAEQDGEEQQAAEPPIEEGEALSETPSDVSDSNVAASEFSSDNLEASQLPVDEAIENAAAPDLSASNATFAPEPAPTSTPRSADLKVMYVLSDGTALVTSPNGSPVSPGLKQGDPVLTKPEGQWKNIVGRGYLKSESLSDRPVGRQKFPNPWR